MEGSHRPTEEIMDSYLNHPLSIDRNRDMRNRIEGIRVVLSYFDPGYLRINSSHPRFLFLRTIGPTPRCNWSPDRTESITCIQPALPIPICRSIVCGSVKDPESNCMICQLWIVREHESCHPCHLRGRG